MGAIEFMSGFSAATLLGGMTTILTAYIGVIVLVVFLPFVSTFILDGVVHVFRGRGLKPLLIGVAFTVVVAIVGVATISYGQPEGGPAPETAAGMASIAELLLPFSVGLALLAFVFRTISTFSRSSAKSRRSRA